MEIGGGVGWAGFSRFWKYFQVQVFEPSGFISQKPRTSVFLRIGVGVFLSFSSLQ